MISSLSYYTDATNQVTATDPQLPWSVTLDVEPGANVMITATGTTEDGEVGVSFEALGNGEYVLMGDTCSKSQN